MSSRHQSSRAVRLASGLLALVWLSACFASIVAQLTLRAGCLVLSASRRFGTGYFGVALRALGLLTVRDTMPWRVGKRSDA